MRYALLIYGPQWDPTGMTPEQQQQSMDEWTDYTADLVRSGVHQAGEALKGIETATTVRLRDGEVITTDGPFAETKEVLGGFYIFDAANLDDAIEIAAKCPGASNGSIELRPVEDLGEEYEKEVKRRAGVT
jgi:hypothetical protein